MPKNYKLDGLTDFERNYVLPIYGYILGGGPDSRLFKTVREKHSLCYTVSSSILDSLYRATIGISIPPITWVNSIIFKYLFLILIYLHKPFLQVL